MLIDTHCHIHEASYPLDVDETIIRAHEQGITKMICIGTDKASSLAGVPFARAHENVYATVGIHPHETKDGYEFLEAIEPDRTLVGIGEIGLDYFYTHSPKEVQIQALEWQIDFALRRNLPIVFHVREAFDDFWPIFDNFKGIRGELHSFTDSQKNMEMALSRGLLFGVNGISTFSKSEVQNEMFKAIPLGSLLFETDAPFLTPVPFRGKINEPAFIRNIAEIHAVARGISLDEIASETSKNATALFAL